MAFPTVIAVNGGNSVTNETSITVNLPDGSNVAGRLLLCFFTTDGSGETHTFPADFTWTRLVADGGTGFTSSVWYRVTTGTEGYAATGATITVTNSSIEMSAHTTYLLGGVHGSTAPEASTPTTGSSTAPDAGALNPAGWGTEDTLWFTFASLNGLSSTTPRISAYPTDYTNGRSDIAANGNGVTQGVARRENATASEDAGAFTSDTTGDWRAVTIGVRPALVTNGVVLQTQGDNTLGATGALKITGTLTQTQADNTLESTATLTSSGGISGVVLVTQGDDTLSATGALAIKAITEQTQADNVLTSTGTLSLAAIVNQTQADNTLSSTAALQIKANADQTQAGDTLASTAALSIVANLNQTQADNVSTATGALYIQANVTTTQDNNTLAAIGTGTVTTQGVVDVTQDANTITSTATLSIVANGAITQADNTPSITATLALFGAVGVAQDNNTLSALGELDIRAVMTATQDDNTLNAYNVIFVADRDVTPDLRYYKAVRAEQKQDLNSYMDKYYG